MPSMPFENDNNKYSRKDSRVNKYNPAFNNPVAMIGNAEKDGFDKNQEKWEKTVAYFR